MRQTLYSVNRTQRQKQPPFQTEKKNELRNIFQRFNNKKFLFVQFLLVTLIGCTSNSVFMDARPNGVKNEKLLFGLSLRDASNIGAKNRDTTHSDISVAPIDIAVLSGIHKQADVYLKYTFPLTTNIGIKIGFDTLQENKLHYQAIGASLGLDFISLLQDTIKSQLYFDFKVHYIETFCVGQRLSISLIPHIIFRDDYNKFQFLGGAALSFQLGKYNGLIFEGIYDYNTKFRGPEYQIGICGFVTMKHNIISF